MQEEWKTRVRGWRQRVYVDADEASGTDGIIAVECVWEYDSDKDEDIREEYWLAVTTDPGTPARQLNPDAPTLPAWLKDLVSRIRTSAPYL